MPNAVKKIKRKSFHLNDLIKTDNEYYIAVMRDKDLTCFAKTNKSKSKCSYTKLFIVATTFENNGNFKFEFA
mgnify:FL=1